MTRRVPHPATTPVLVRLAALAPLDPDETGTIQKALGQPAAFRIRQDLLSEGAAIAGPRLIVSGWAARVRVLADGRRQLLSFLLPGDLIGLYGQADPLAVSTVTALTDVATCPAPPANDAAPLGQAYAASKALEEAYLLEQIVRLGRMNAQERIFSLLLELNERLVLAGLASDGTFAMPLTQEMLADALGLTSVHVNRMLQQARRADQLDWQRGRVTLSDPAALAREIGRAPTRVSAAAA